MKTSDMITRSLPVLLWLLLTACGNSTEKNNAIDSNDTNDSNISRLYPVIGESIVVEPGDTKNCVDLTQFESYPDYTVQWTIKTTRMKTVANNAYSNYTVAHSEKRDKGIRSGQQRKSYHLKVENKSLPVYYMYSAYTLETDDYTLGDYSGMLMRKVTKNTRHISNPISIYGDKTIHMPNDTITTRYVPYRLYRIKSCVGSILKQTYTENSEDHGYLVEYYNKVVAIGERKCVKAGCFDTVHEHEIFKNNTGTSDTQVWVDLKTGVLVRVEGNIADAELIYISPTRK